MTTAVADRVEALAGLPTGPRLAALAAIDPARVPNTDLLALLRAQSRQTAHEAARLLGVIAEVGRARPIVAKPESGFRCIYRTQSHFRCIARRRRPWPQSNQSHRRASQVS
jgi:hypothetical protein